MHEWRTETKTVNGKEPELGSAKIVAEMLDVKIRTVREWVTRARNKPSPDSIPFVQIPGSRLIRFPLKGVREWYQRGTFRDVPQMHLG